MAKRWIIIEEDDSSGCLWTLIGWIIVIGIVVTGIVLIFSAVAAIVKAIVAFIMSIAVYLLCGFAMVLSVVVAWYLIFPLTQQIWLPDEKTGISPQAIILPIAFVVISSACIIGYGMHYHETRPATTVVENKKKTETAYGFEYWNGDLNSPIFIKRQDGSMVTFKKDSARISDRTYENGNELVVFRGCEVNPNGTFTEYGYYGIFFDEGKNYYYVCYPKTKNFPDGKQIDVKNQRQQDVCKFMIKAGRNNGTIHLD